MSTRNLSSVEHVEQLPKLLIILGTTAVGKTRLSLEIVKALSNNIPQNIPEHKCNENEASNDYRAEIISADSVQVYKRMEICSDVVTQEESDGISHHLVTFLEPHEHYSVQDFVKHAKKAIDDIHSRGKIAIIAGGTLYYTESLLIRNLSSQIALKEKNILIDENHENITINIQSIADNNELWEELNKIDPVMANFYHRNDIRRIRRSLEIYNQSGGQKLHSSLIRETGGKYGTQLRYQPLILWLDADLETIDGRINKRLITMEDSGIFEEIENLYQFLISEYNYDALSEDGNLMENGKLSDYGMKEECAMDDNSASVYISIAHGFGFQSFIPWLRAKFRDGNSEQQLKDIRKQCIMKYGMETSRYARKQKRWLKNRIEKSHLLLPFIFKFDTSDIHSTHDWNENVLQPAMKIVTDFFDNNHCRSILDGKESKMMPKLHVFEWKNIRCDSCEKLLHGQLEYDIHMSSNKHKRRLHSLRQKRKNLQKYLSFHRMCSF